ncbi:hypothetical protein HDV00_008324 [Rhizophlyctis rosea]|nr:hypothetical protein HDV00_008324 [Rhizophlyctis rosea]
MSFSFRKPSKAKSLRKKVQDDDAEDEVIATDSVVHPKKSNGTAAREQKTDTKKQSKLPSYSGTALSFGGDEEPESDAFVVKKSAASRRMMKANLIRELFPDTPIATAEQSSDYSAESLRILKESQRTRPPTTKRTETPVNEVFSSEFEAIPDAAAIHAARKRREELRAAGISGDTATGFISLSGDKPEKIVENESRLVTEDQEIDGEEAFDDYAGDTINFGGDAVKKEERRRKAEFEANLLEAQEEDVEDEEEEELRQWELEQIRKGRSKKQNDEPAPSEPPKPQVYRIPNAISIPSSTNVSQRITNLVATKQNNHDANLAMLAHTKADLDTSVSAAAALEVDRKLSSERYTYYQELLQYIRELADFLDAKFPELETLETDYQDILNSAVEVVHTRRLGLADNDFSQIVGIEGVAPQSETGTTALLHARQRRRHARLRARQEVAASETPEGLSTDDELEPEDEADMQERKVVTRNKSSRLFEDAMEDFRSIILIKQRFETWKSRHSKDYENGFGSLSMPGVFELFVRQELLDWEPLQSPATFESMHWHKQLSNYGLRDMSDIDDDDPDTKLLIKIVEKSCIPRLRARIGSFVPWSGRQSKALRRVLGQLLDYTDTSSAPFQNLINAIETKFEDAVTGWTQRYVFHATAASRPSSEQSRLSRNRFFWTGFKLFQNMFTFKRYLSREALQQWAVSMLLDGCMLRSLEGSEDVEDVYKYEKILECIPNDWIGDTYSVPDFLSGLEAQMKDSARRIAPVLSRDSDLTSRLTNLFVHIKSFDQASRLDKLHR